ncbi:MAG: hypothetical protein H0U31_04495 [Chloroflexia bacterium]|nr:hypothetical protein [Chloroflexia bacterium]
MTSLQSIAANADRSPFERLAANASASMPQHSRRDLVRVAALLAGVAGAATNVARGPSTRAYAQDEIETDVELTIPFNPFGQIVSLDPHRALNWGPFWVLMPHVWAGLLAFDENGAVVNDLAESIAPNETADVWTVQLQPDLRFASGNPITAQSFVDSWLRALHPAAPAPMASFMSDVQGYDAYIAGDSSDIGFAALDDLTIEITLAEAFSSFPASLATFVWAVVDLSVVDDPDVDDPMLAGASAGLWQFTEFIDGDRIAMGPNPNSAALASPSISRIVWLMLEGPEADADAIDLYTSDKVVSADVPASLLETVTSNEAIATELIEIESQSSTMAIGMDFNQSPFDDVRVRRAVAAAIDHESWANEIWGGEFVPASSLVPPVVQITSGYEPMAPVEFNPENASGLLEEADIDLEESSPDIVYYQPASDSPDLFDKHAALLAMIEEHAGLTIRHDTTLTQDQIVALQRDNGGRQFDIVWWWTVTDTPALLQTIGHSESPFMQGWFNWSPALEANDEQSPGDASAEFDEAIAAANSATDSGARNDAFRQAEELLIDNAVYVPLGHWVQRYVQKPWLIGTRQGPWSGRIPVRFDADVVVQGRTPE